MSTANRQLDLFAAPSSTITPDLASRHNQRLRDAQANEDRDERPSDEMLATGPRELTFVSIIPDRSDTSRYVHIIRDKSDPQRAPRGATSTPFAWRKINDASPEQWADAVVTHLADGVPRTFNRIALELATMTADIAFGTTLDEGLWLAVGAGRLVLTLDAPVFFTVASPQT